MSIETALVQWLAGAIGAEKLTLQQLKDPLYLHKLTQELPDLEPIDFTNS